MMGNKTILLIPHYNNPKGLQKSIESLKKEEIDLLIVDDGSYDEISEHIIKKSFQAKGNIYFLYLKENKGIEFALNEGLNYILSQKKYKYIARLDCGDLCLNNRFKKQESFLDKNSHIKLVGSNVICINEQNQFLYNLIMPDTYNEIKNKMYINCMLIHPTVMFSADIFPVIGLYPINYKYAEDYALFFNVMQKYAIANINEFLVKIEINTKGISIQRRKKQIKSRIKIIKEHFYIGIYPIYGLIRSYLLLCLPYKLVFLIKKQIWR